jgi:hypothetical protein
MSARSPRKVFANPFVITLAAIPACFTESTSPPPQQPQQPVTTAPAQPAPGGEVVVANPPRPTPGGEAQPAPAGPAPGAPQTYTFDQRWTVMKSSNGCTAMQRVDCPKPTKAGGPVPTCNPPPPMKIECPADWDGKQTLAVVQYANNEKCEIERAPMKCPQGAMCNPPPPRYVACPTYK